MVGSAAHDAMVARLLATPPPESAPEYYEELAARQPGVRVAFTKRKGKSLVATKAFAPGDLILAEPPLAAAQDPHNARVVLACQHCFRILGPSLEAHIGRALRAMHEDPELVPSDSENESEDWSDEEGPGCSQGQTPDALPSQEIASALIKGHLRMESDAEAQPPAPVWGDSGSAYCSASCRDAAWADYEGVLCRDAAAADDFASFVEATNPAFAVVARFIASTVSDAMRLMQESNKSPEEALLEAWRPVAWGQKALWWELPVADEDADVIAEERRELCEDAAEYLCAMMPDARFAALCDARVIGSLLGMIELNNLALVVASPAHAWVNSRDGGGAAAGPSASALSDLARFVRRRGRTLDVDGTGFYRLHSCCNHSCVPNAHAFKRPGDDRGDAVVLALRTIETGDEITLSYIDEEAPFEERRAALMEYLFECDCPKCQARQ